MTNTTNIVLFFLKCLKANVCSASSGGAIHVPRVSQWKRGGPPVIVWWLWWQLSHFLSHPPATWSSQRRLEMPQVPSAGEVQLHYLWGRGGPDPDVIHSLWLETNAIEFKMCFCFYFAGMRQTSGRFWLRAGQQELHLANLWRHGWFL